jgi:uncharacterized protein YcbK (DUF882 family)
MVCTGDSFETTSASLTRGAFLGGLVAATVLPLSARAAAWYQAPYRSLDVVRLDDGERVQAAFTEDGRTLSSGYVLLCDALRDAHVEVNRGVVQMSPALFQVLWEIQQVIASRYGLRPLVNHSGYRTLETNGRTEGAVRNSVHCAGGACDFHVDGVPLAEIARISANVPLIGGLGFYPRGGDGSDQGWVHVDVGRRRDWVG